MKNEFSLNLAVSINTKEQIIDFNWTSCSNKILGIEIQPPADISQTVNILVQDVYYALPVLAFLFRTSSSKQIIKACAMVKFFCVNGEWRTVFFAENDDVEQDKYIKTLLFKLLHHRNSFLKEVKSFDKKYFKRKEETM